MKKSVAFIIILIISLSARGQGGPVSNSHVVPRNDGSGLFDVYYELSGGSSSYNIELEVSFDDGNTYTPVPANYLSGHISNVSPGNDKHIVWDGLGSFPDIYSVQARLKVTATATGEWPRDTETAVVDVTNPATGKTWMDRNLGASRAATSSTDAAAYGDLYQWGRAADGHQKRNSGTTSTLSSSNTPGHGNFILAPNYPYDWRSPQEPNLWQGVNGVNNPCPTGYRLPTNAELDTERQSWSSNSSAGAFASPLKLPVAGTRDGLNGSLVNAGSYSSYWSSTVDGIYSRSLHFYSGAAGMYSNHRASGFSVRCLKDDSVVPTKYSLNLGVNPPGAGEVSGGGEFEAGEVVAISATANAGWVFVEWTGDTDYVDDPTTANANVTMPGYTITLTANFEEDSDPDSGTFTDSRDGETYKWVKIDNQVWMAENLNWIPSNDYGGWSGCYDNNVSNCDNYGRLYTWPSAMQGASSSSITPSGIQGVCPPGWHVPSHNEWTQLEQYVCNQLGNSDCATKFPYNNTTTGGRGTNEGNALKSCRQVDSPLGGACNTSDHPRWDSHSTHYGTDAFGFSALPGGNHHPDGSFYGIGRYGYWWSSTEGSATAAWGRDLYYWLGSVLRYGNRGKANGFSVRCVRYDIPAPINHQLNLEVIPPGAGEVSGGGEFEAGAVVAISATANAGWVFVEWTGDTDYLDDPTTSHATVTMPAYTITLTANFEEEATGDWPRDTETAVVDVTNPTTGKTWMDRNLGASRAATSSTDAEAYGDLYQWGRAADGHQKRGSGTTSTLSNNNDTPGHGNFILAPNSPYDWRSPQNTNLWQGVNGVNNPCPPGYRLPTNAELDAERLNWSSNNSAGAFASPLKLPVGGVRGGSNDSFYNVGSFGVYWSSTVDGIYTRGLSFSGDDAGMPSFGRANGFSVRCLKDDSAVPTKYSLNLGVNPAGAGEVSGGGEFEAGEEVSITATANAGWEFVEWTGDTDYVDDPATANAIVTMPAYTITLTANFEEESDPDSGTFTDSRDGETYKWVKIGNQVWMAENLRHLPSVVGPGTGSGTTPYYYVYGYNGTDVNAAKATANYQNYGVLYNWPAAMNENASSSANPSGVQGVCPTGWHVPSDGQWTELVNYVVSQGYPNSNVVGGAGNALKSCRQVGSPLGGACNTSDHPRWDSHGTHYGTDAFGFSALPGGTRNTSGSFDYVGYGGYWWSATEGSSTPAWNRRMYNTLGNVGSYNNSKAFGFSLRCIRDN